MQASSKKPKKKATTGLCQKRGLNFIQQQEKNAGFGVPKRKRKKKKKPNLMQLQENRGKKNRKKEMGAQALFPELPVHFIYEHIARRLD